MQQIGISHAAGAAALAEVEKVKNHAISNAWALTHGAGNRKGAWAIGGKLGRLLHRVGCMAMMLSFPVIAVYM
jgi:preprotein translocase subunit SecF